VGEVLLRNEINMAGKINGRLHSRLLVSPESCRPYAQVAGRVEPYGRIVSL
jgi:hypothetical protein